MGHRAAKERRKVIKNEIKKGHMGPEAQAVLDDLERTLQARETELKAVVEQFLKLAEVYTKLKGETDAEKAKGALVKPVSTMPTALRQGKVL